MRNISKNHRAWAEINLDNLRHNYFEIKKYTKKKICAIIKCDAYGHGAKKILEVLYKLGVRYFAVASIEEALKLKNNNNINILILGFIPENKIATAMKNDFVPTVYGLSEAENINSIAEKLGLKARVHIKIDTGMHRLGFDVGQKTIEQIRKISALSNIKLEGIFSHFVQSEIKNDLFTRDQYSKFKFIIDELDDLCLIRHISNSAGIINYSDCELDLVRAGLILYGFLPLHYSKINLMPVLELKSQLVSLRIINAGESVSYNRGFIATKKTKIGIVSIGYGDGYMRNNSNKARVIVNGRLAKIIGNICMDYLMIDLSGIEAEIGDEVILIGRKNNLSVTADDLAEINNTIPYEILTSIGKRIPRIYL